jgi:HEAT repeat protein
MSEEKYLPASEFLQAMVAEVGAELSEANLRQIIQMMQDEDRSNRDWATFLIAQQDVDTPAVRDALMCASGDDDAVVRAEAAWGLARRDPRLALPLVQEGLRASKVYIPMLDAAALCADPSLIADLRVWAEPSDNPLIDERAAEALAACEKSTPSTS